MYTLQKRVGRDGTIGDAQGMKPPRTSLSPPLAPNFLKISMHFQNLVFYFQAKLKGLVHQMLIVLPSLTVSTLIVTAPDISSLVPLWVWQCIVIYSTYAKLLIGNQYGFHSDQFPLYVLSITTALLSHTPL